MSLQNSSKDILSQLVHLMDQLDEKQYAASMQILSKSSVGKHVRHIIEFYECLLNGLNSGTVNYDARVRNTLLETDLFFAIQVILDIIQKIQRVRQDCWIKLRVELSLTNGLWEEMETTFFRELAYNIEHAIHHMAIIKIAIQVQYPEVIMDENFGVAYSTIRHKEKIQYTH